jgi:hypothetical protein
LIYSNSESKWEKLNAGIACPEALMPITKPVNEIQAKKNEINIQYYHSYDFLPDFNFNHGRTGTNHSVNQGRSGG